MSKKRLRRHGNYLIADGMWWEVAAAWKKQQSGIWECFRRNDYLTGARCEPVAYLVTEAHGRLTEPVALVGLEEGGGTPEQFRELAVFLGWNHDCISNVASREPDVIDLRGCRDPFNVPPRLLQLIFREGCYVGTYRPGGAAVLNMGAAFNQFTGRKDSHVQAKEAKPQGTEQRV